MLQRLCLADFSAADLDTVLPTPATPTTEIVIVAGSIHSRRDLSDLATATICRKRFKWELP
jgi:hypothetical protein